MATEFYCFSPKKGSKQRYQLCVTAVSLGDARAYVSLDALHRRELRYVGSGAPAKPDGWIGAVTERARRAIVVANEGE